MSIMDLVAPIEVRGDRLLYILLYLLLSLCTQEEEEVRYSLHLQLACRCKEKKEVLLLCTQEEEEVRYSSISYKERRSEIDVPLYTI